MRRGRSLGRSNCARLRPSSRRSRPGARVGPDSHGTAGRRRNRRRREPSRGRERHLDERDDDRLRYQWYRCNAAGADCLSVHGATSPTYTLVARDVGKTVGLRARDRLDRDGGGATRASSARSRPRGRCSSRRCSRSSTAFPGAGKDAEVTTGAWSPMLATFTYTWERCNANGRACAPIRGARAGATRSTRRPGPRARRPGPGDELGDDSRTRFSIATRPRSPRRRHRPDGIRARPTVTGAAGHRARSHAAPLAVDGKRLVAFAYQWYRCDADGAHCAAIAGATARDLCDRRRRTSARQSA